MRFLERKSPILGFALLAALAPMLPAADAIAEAPNLGAAANYAVLALENGTLTINSGTTLVGNVGYCSGVASTTNQKVSSFQGGAYVHSEASFACTPATFGPTQGIHYGSADPSVDAALDQAHLDAVAASAAAASLTPTHVLGVLGDNDSRTIQSTGPVNVVSITSLSYNDDQIEFVSRPGYQDYFIVNVSGDFDFSQSRVNLVGVTAGQVLWNFPGASAIDINKDTTVFAGTILAPAGNVIYHNPATFTGAIIAKNIYLHSAFNLTYRQFPYVSVTPATWGEVKAKYRDVTR